MTTQADIDAATSDFLNSYNCSVADPNDSTTWPTAMQCWLSACNGAGQQIQSIGINAGNLGPGYVALASATANPQYAATWAGLAASCQNVETQAVVTAASIASNIAMFQAQIQIADFSEPTSDATVAVYNAMVAWVGTVISDLGNYNAIAAVMNVSSSASQAALVSNVNTINALTQQISTYQAAGGILGALSSAAKGVGNFFSGFLGNVVGGILGPVVIYGGIAAVVIVGGAVIYERYGTGKLADKLPSAKRG